VKKEQYGKAVISILSIGVTLWLATLFFSSAKMKVFLSAGLFLAQIGGLYLLLKTGTLLKSLYWITVGALLILLAVGAVFQLQHWPGASLIFLFAAIGLASVYSVSFLFKKQKEILDVIKVLWVLSYTAQILTRNFHLIENTEAHYWQQGNFLLFFGTLALLAREQYKAASSVALES